MQTSAIFACDTDDTKLVVVIAAIKREEWRIKSLGASPLKRFADRARPLPSGRRIQPFTSSEPPDNPVNAGSRLAALLQLRKSYEK